MNRKTFLLTIFLIFILISSSIARVSYYAGGGMAIPISPKDFQAIVNTGTTIYFGAGVRYYRLNEITLGVAKDHLPAKPDNEDYDGGSINITTLLLDFRIRGLRDYQRRFRKHLIGSVGYSIFDYTATGVGSLSRWTLGGGVGMEYKISKHKYFWLDMKVNVLFGIRDKPNYDGMARLCLNICGGLRYNLANW